MGMLHRLCTGTALGLVGALALTPPATAQQAGDQSIDRIVAFGDSYADTGNLFKIVPAPTPINPYPTGRFSGGTNFVDTLGTVLEVPQVNYAIGGATSGSFNVTTNSFPGFVQQYTGAAIGGYTGFNAATQRLNRSDLVAISIGGNDARRYALGGGTTAGASASATISAQQATTGINALRAAGGQNFLFLAGDTGSLPELAPQPAVAAAARAFSNSYNAQIRGALGQLAASGATVDYLDLSRVFQSIAANPAAFGLTNLGPCPAAACVPDQGAASAYLFYFDGLHLTSKGFAIVGQYAAAQVNAPLTLQAQGDLGVCTMQGFGRALTGRLDGSALRSGTETKPGLTLFALATGADGSGIGSAQSNPYDYNSLGAVAGLEYALGNNALIGLAGGWSRPEAEFNRGGGRIRAQAWHVGAYVGFASASGLFVQGHAAYGKLDTKIRRAAVIDDLRADPEGTAWSAGAKGGILFDLGSVRFGPVASIDYVRVTLDAYTETGDAVLTQTVGKQRERLLNGFAGVELRLPDGQGIGGVAPYLSGGVESVLDSSDRTVTATATASPEIVNRYTLAGESGKIYGRVNGGARLGLTDAIAIDINLSATIERQRGNEQGGSIGLRVGF